MIAVYFLAYKMVLKLVSIFHIIDQNYRPIQLYFEKMTTHIKEYLLLTCKERRIRQNCISKLPLTTMKNKNGKALLTYNDTHNLTRQTLTLDWRKMFLGLLLTRSCQLVLLVFLNHYYLKMTKTIINLYIFVAYKLRSEN